MSFFNEHFKENYRFALKNINYQKNDIDTKEKIELLCNDDVDIEISNDYVNITLTRTLVADPVKLFEIMVAFEVILFFIDGDQNNLDQSEIEERLINEESDLLDDIAGRISLLIAQITSSYGNPPIVTPPVIMIKKDDAQE
ncbi:hypothetical protein SAMN04515656_10357 [Eubacterium aggregans]|uniref:Preprotein translocase subunit SecB n=1 Tax=Eubacterium aggregans TaxID=81409 RepID=A0A1H3Y3V8_9FIRM|nr:hypothetical protein [Eubacterium aggregans]SEA06405.1 hypothetical protein SAMN04515656_10357 [Eubacterium aggregans]